jgi:hypothetical protein
VEDGFTHRVSQVAGERGVLMTPTLNEVLEYRDIKAEE